MSSEAKEAVTGAMVETVADEFDALMTKPIRAPAPATVKHPKVIVQFDKPVYGRNDELGRNELGAVAIFLAPEKGRLCAMNRVTTKVVHAHEVRLPANTRFVVVGRNAHGGIEDCTPTGATSWLEAEGPIEWMDAKGNWHVYSPEQGEPWQEFAERHGLYRRC